jgi:hypothetical protein
VHHHHRLQDRQDPPTEEKGGAAPGPPSSRVFSFFFSSLSLSLVPQILPLVYKRKGWVPQARKAIQARKNSNTEEQFNSTSSSLETWILSLSRLFVTPTTNTSASNTSSLELDVGTFCLNQYTPLCPLAHHPDQTCKHKFTRQWYETLTVLNDTSNLLEYVLALC